MRCLEIKVTFKFRSLILLSSIPHNNTGMTSIQGNLRKSMDRSRGRTTGSDGNLIRFGASPSQGRGPAFTYVPYRQLPPTQRCFSTPTDQYYPLPHHPPHPPCQGEETATLERNIISRRSLCWNGHCLLMGRDREDTDRLAESFGGNMSSKKERSIETVPCRSWGSSTLPCRMLQSLPHVRLCNLFIAFFTSLSFGGGRAVTDCLLFIL